MADTLSASTDNSSPLISGQAWRATSGNACRQALPEVARQAWPEIKGLELSVDADNVSAIALYAKFGWVDSGEAYKGRIGYERRMGLIF